MTTGTPLAPARPVCSWQWPDDLDLYREELAALLIASAADDGVLGYAGTDPEPAHAFAAGLAEAVEDGDAHVLVGTDGDGVAAMCVLEVNQQPNCRHLAEVRKAYLRPRLRGTSAVLELAAQVCAKAREQGAEKLTIDVREGTKAHRVWEHLGFTTFGVLEDYARVDGRSHRGCYMVHSVAALEEYLAARLADRAGR